MYINIFFASLPNILLSTYNIHIYYTYYNLPHFLNIYQTNYVGISFDGLINGRRNNHFNGWTNYNRSVFKRRNVSFWRVVNTLKRRNLFKVKRHSDSYWLARVYTVYNELWRERVEEGREELCSVWVKNVNCTNRFWLVEFYP